MQQVSTYDNKDVGNIKIFTVSILDVPYLPTAQLTHKGDPQSLPKSISHFIE